MKRMFIVVMAFVLASGCNLSYFLSQETMGEAARATVKIAEDGIKGTDELLDAIKAQEEHEALYQRAVAQRERFEALGNFAKAEVRIADPYGQAREPGTSVGASQEWSQTAIARADKIDEYAAGWGARVAAWATGGTAAGGTVLSIVLAWLMRGRGKQNDQLAKTGDALKDAFNKLASRWMGEVGDKDAITGAYAGTPAEPEIKAAFKAKRQEYEKLAEAAAKAKAEREAEEVAAEQPPAATA